MAGSAPDVQDVKRMMGRGSGNYFVGDGFKRLCPNFFLYSLILQKVAVELFFLHVFQKSVADPIGLHDPVVKWIPDVVGLGYKPKVRIKGFEFLKNKSESGVSGAFFNVVVNLPRFVGTAVMQAIRTERITAAARQAVNVQNCAVCYADGCRSGCGGCILFSADLAKNITSAAPAIKRNELKNCIAVKERVMKIADSILVTSVAGTSRAAA